MPASAFYTSLGLPESCRLDKRIFKRMLLEHGDLTSADKKALSESVAKLTWKYTLKANTVQVRPYEDPEREYLEIAVIEVVLTARKQADRLAEMIQRAIPYPVLLVLGEGEQHCVSVAHKRFSKAEAGRIVATDFLRTPWIGAPTSKLDEAFLDALAFNGLSHVDFYAMYGSIVKAVLARNCASLSGHFTLDATTTEDDRRQQLEQCIELDREISRTKTSLHEANGFAEKVELNTRIKELDARMATAKASL